MGGRSTIVLIAAMALITGTPAAAATFKEYSVGSYPGQQPRYIKAGPDGNLWYADGGTEGGIGRISPTGEMFKRVGGGGPVDIAFAADGTAYWAGDKGTGRRNPDGVIDESELRTSDYAAAVSPTGEFWFSTDEATWCFGELFRPGGGTCGFFRDTEEGRITSLVFDRKGDAWGAFNEENVVRELSGEDTRVDLPTGSKPSRIAIGPEGDLWVTMFDASSVDRITPEGQRTRFPLSPGAGPNDIALGPDGAFWITEYGADKIARMTTSGVLTGEFPVPTAGAHPTGIAAGPDGAMWFTEIDTAKIGRIVIDPSTTTPDPDLGGGVGGLAGTRDTTPPSFTHGLSMRPSRFRVSGRGTRLIPKGSSLRLTLSEASSVKVEIAAARPGRRAQGSCQRTSKANRGKPHCRRYVTVGSVSYKALAGANRFTFNGRVAGHTLKPGEYRLSAVATDAAGNGSAPSKVSFTIVR
jgi:virginiamycin B lyase